MHRILDTESSQSILTLNLLLKLPIEFEEPLV